MLVHCPNCNAEIEDDSRFCERCGHSLNNNKTDNIITKQQRPPSVFYAPFPVKEFVILILSIVGFSMFCFKACSCVSNSNSNNSYLESIEDNKLDAYLTAKNSVKSRLKSPSTAEFPSYNDSYVTYSGSTYTVSAYVDAENSFGATVRTYFKVTMVDSGYKWTNINVEIYE